MLVVIEAQTVPGGSGILQVLDDYLLLGLYLHLIISI